MAGALCKKGEEADEGGACPCPPGDEAAEPVGTTPEGHPPDEEDDGRIVGAAQDALLYPDDNSGELIDWRGNLQKGTNADLTTKERWQVARVLEDNQDAFQRWEGELGRVTDVVHRIDTGASNPIRQRYRRLPPHKREAVEEEIERMLRLGVLEPSTGSWASPIVPVSKKDGKLRFCVDFRALNSVTRKDAYPIPRIGEVLELLQGAAYFCTLDLASGYWQVPMHEADREKTATITHLGLYQFTVLPFGLCNAPSTFERMMETLLKGMVGKDCLVYLDDVIVFGRTMWECLARLEDVLGRVAEAGLKLRSDKCHLFEPEVKFLGHVVSKAGIATDPEKLRAVDQWPRPQDIKGLRAFLGFCSYYRTFVPDFATTAAPLHALLGKGVEFQWGHECEQAMLELKKKMMQAPVLAFPRAEGEWVVDTDASNVGLGAVLSQRQPNGEERVLMFASRSLGRPERNYCVTRRELLAVVFAIRKFRHYLTEKITVRTDHNALRWLLGFKEPEGQLARWLIELSSYDIDVQHRPGAQHANADGLSRLPLCLQCGREEEPAGESRPPAVGMLTLGDTTLGQAQARCPVSSYFKMELEHGPGGGGPQPVQPPFEWAVLNACRQQLSLRESILGRLDEGDGRVASLRAIRVTTGGRPAISRGRAGRAPGGGEDGRGPADQILLARAAGHSPPGGEELPELSDGSKSAAT